MKKAFLFMLSILLFTMVSKAQINLEHEFPQIADYEYMEGNYFYSVDYVSSQCTVYNLDYSIKKSISIPVPANWYLNDVAYVSKNMFNSDDLIEMLVVYYRYIVVNDTTGYYEYTTKVVNENGNELLDVEGGGYSSIYSTSDNKTKLIVYVYDFSTDPVGYATNVYSIPGSPSAVQNVVKQQEAPDPYPNPAGESIHIPFTLNDNRTGSSLIITDINGKIIRNQKISGNKGTIEINTVNLSSGQYLYTILSPGKPPVTKKFIVK